MAYPRYLQVPPNAPGTYHCVSRCVRRAFLCGDDAVSGRRFDHRKEWVEKRIIELASVFSMAVNAYAVMSNHFHLVIETDPNAPNFWSDDEVARRWLSLSSPAAKSNLSFALRIAALSAQPERLAVLRHRLGSLSWYMRFLKEPIARQANREDECSGRFWEGRFRVQALLDDTSVLASMVYVDLNPIRAKIASTPEQSLFTSICQRIQAARHAEDEPIQPLASSIDSQLSVVSTREYIELVEWTGRTLHPGRRGVIPSGTPSIVWRLGLRKKQWMFQVPATESHYRRAIGQVDALIEFARLAGLKWLHGIGTARRVRRLSASG
ncbi:MAG: REP element-mobilizing transposase RayT [Gammaproteobacteria bacterium]|jgi:REP element-mobilizing transposase RayT